MPNSPKGPPSDAEFLRRLAEARVVARARREAEERAVNLQANVPVVVPHNEDEVKKQDKSTNN